ncbi:MAG: hypothetical protein ACOCYQ_08895, partial [Alkalispirochaeta sp.]
MYRQVSARAIASFSMVVISFSDVVAPVEATDGSTGGRTDGCDAVPRKISDTPVLQVIRSPGTRSVVATWTR